MTGGSRCHCCPYGYHIDLDFVRYCDLLYNGAYLWKLRQLRRNHNRQRKSMEAYVGLTEDALTKNEDEATNIDDPMALVISLRSFYLPSPVPDLSTNGGLREAVLDFEETLLSSKLSTVQTRDSDFHEKLQLHLLSSRQPRLCHVDLLSTDPHVFAENKKGMTAESSQVEQSHNVRYGDSSSIVIHPFAMPLTHSDSNSSMSSASTLSSIGVDVSSALEQGKVGPSASQQMADTMATLASASTLSHDLSSSVVGISRLTLTSIREQMALSLKKMRDLEDQLRALPILQVKLSVLKEEKRLLLLQLKARNSKLDYDNTESQNGKETGAPWKHQTEWTGEHDLNAPGNGVSKEKHYCDLEEGIINYQVASEDGAIDTGSRMRIRSIGTHCGVLTREVGVGHIPERLKSIGISVESTVGALCSMCHQRIHWISSASSSEMAESDSDGESMGKVFLSEPPRREHYQNKGSVVMHTHSTNTNIPVQEISQDAVNLLRARKMDQLTFDVCEQISIVPTLQPCSSYREGFHQPCTDTVNTGINTELKLIDVVTREEIGNHKKVLKTFGVQVLPPAVKCRDFGVTTDTAMLASKPVLVSRGVGIGQVQDVVCDKCRNVQKRTTGVGYYNVHDVLCDHCSHLITKSTGVGDFLIGDHLCRQCEHCANITTRSIGCGTGTIHDTYHCDKCELRQTETVGVGENSILDVLCTKCSNLHMVDKAVGDCSMADIQQATVKRQRIAEDLLSHTSSSESIGIHVCDKCNATIHSVAKDLVENHSPVSSQSLYMQPSSRIPRPVSQHESQRVGDSFKDVPPTIPSISIAKSKSVDKTTSFEAVYSPATILQNVHDQLTSEKTPRRKKKVRQVTVDTPKRIELPKEVKGACKVLNDYLQRPEKEDAKKLNTCLSIIQQEWFKVSSQKNADPHVVECYLDGFEEFSKHLLDRIVNLTDSNGNTAMHYAVSLGNFDVVSVLLDSKVCDVSKQNKAGYTCIMLVSLAEMTNDVHCHVVQRLFKLGDINTKASQHGQTALMLAASHGRVDTVRLLLEAGAEPNLQDNDGSTALMCAAEHGHKEIVQMLLASPDCDATLVDHDGSSALSVAVEAGHKDLGLMIYAATNFSRGSSPYTSLQRRRRGSTDSNRSTPRSRTPPSRTPPPPSPSWSRKSSSSIT